MEEVYHSRKHGDTKEDQVVRIAQREPTIFIKTQKYLYSRT